MNGHVIRGTPIAVDFWQLRKCPDAKLFFLTHFHSDHTVGLTSSWNQPIYCSKLTGNLICKKYDILQELIRPMELNTPVLIPIDSTYSEMITVVAIDANHCPGSVMFFFQGYFGCMLYTGDFRYDPNMITDSYLSSVSCSIDTLYLDNTFCDPKCNFLSRNQAKDWITELISYYPGHDIIFGMNNLGKPNLLVEIAKHFQEYIGVPQTMFEYFELIETPDVFQIDTYKHECRLRVVPFYLITEKYLGKLSKPTIAIFPTALYEGLDGSPYCNQNNIYVIPYSDHSSYPELVEFVKRMCPKQIIPIVNANAKGPFNISIAHRADMSKFNQYLSTSPIKKFTMPIYLKNSTPSLEDSRNNFQSSTGKMKKIQRRPASRGIIFESPIKSLSSKPIEENGHFERKISEEKNSNITSILESSPNSSKTDSNSKNVETLQTPFRNKVDKKNSICDVQDTVTGISTIMTPTKSSNQNACFGRNSEIPNTSKENFAEKVSPLKNQPQQLSSQNVIESICRTNNKNYKLLEMSPKISKNVVNCRKQLPMIEQLNNILPSTKLNQTEDETENTDNEKISDSEEFVSKEDDCSTSNSIASTVYYVNEPDVINENIGKKNRVSSKKRKLPSSVCQYLHDYSKDSKRPKKVVDIRIESCNFDSSLWALSSKGNYMVTEQYNTQSQKLISTVIEQNENSLKDISSTSNSSLDFTSKHVLSRNHELQPSMIEIYENIIEKFVLKQRENNLH